MFLSPNMFRYYRLPINFEELVVVTGRFNIKPLLPLFRVNGRFLILVLSQNKVKLFQGTRYTISEINLEREEIPKNMREALKYADIEKQQQYHTGTPPISSKASVAGGERAAIFHGHREDIDEAKKNILEYFNKLDKGLHELLRDERVPLVLVGVDYLLPIYREVNSYPYLIKEGVMGSPRTSNEQELHKQAWAIVQPYFEKAQEDATTKYRQFSRTKHTSNDIKEVALAAYQGRVESLFVAIGVQQWGIFDENTGTVCLHQKEEAGDGDILDFVAAHTILKGGAVYAVEPKKVPDNSLLAAVLRY